MSDLIKTELKDHILTITLNRPEKLNAYTAQMGDEIAHAFEMASEDDAVRVIIVTGAHRTALTKPKPTCQTAILGRM